jgi:hypothetical protein
MKSDVYQQLTEPLYKASINDSQEAVLKEIGCLCTQLRLDQRSIAILGIKREIEKSDIQGVITNQNEYLKSDNDKNKIFLKRVPLKDYDVLILYKDVFYLNLFDEVCTKKKQLSPELFHYVFTKLFGYSDRALNVFVKKWVRKSK